MPFSFPSLTKGLRHIFLSDEGPSSHFPLMNTFPSLTKGLRHISLFDEGPSSHFPLWRRAFVTFPSLTKSLRHISLFDEGPLSHFSLWQRAFVTFPSLTNGLRHISLFDEGPSSHFSLWRRAYTPNVRSHIPCIFRQFTNHFIFQFLFRILLKLPSIKSFYCHGEPLQTRPFFVHSYVSRLSNILTTFWSNTETDQKRTFLRQ